MFEKIVEYYKNIFSNPDPLFIAGQVVGIVLMFFMFFVYSQKKRDNIFIFKIIADSSYIIQNFMVGAFNGALLNIIAVPRDVVFSQRGKRKWANKLIWVFLFVAVTIFTAFLKWDVDSKMFIIEFTIIGLIPATGSVFSCLGLSSTNTKVLKVFALVNTICWTIYSLIVANIGSTISNAIATFSAIVGLFREIEKPKKAVK